ncbi:MULTISPECIES: hypothetical protein [Spirosoma]|uniref:Uncharacterized protein n=1 Tax=Spirosoma liriopis TaxID=2937440 RepID=A0ABT0HRQ6_9BACT|nr:MULTISPECIES: hypothetical protein [Spirosoma]MCK8494303.1 hypothetical protein [Spirosoma liriopis]UHG89315.1 hypothetical protein LQ777_13785 [Spirosoma oryzicola]
MATFTAEISTYSVLFVHGNNQSQTPYRQRFIHLRFKANAGPLEFYSLSFVAEAKYASTGMIEKLKTGAFRGSTTIPIAEFPNYYDVLRNEKPVSIRFDFDEDPSMTPVGELIPLTSFTIFTSDEPLGEGSEGLSK